MLYTAQGHTESPMRKTAAEPEPAIAACVCGAVRIEIEGPGVLGVA